MMALPFASLWVIIMYLGFVYLEFGRLPESISQSYYEFEKRGSGLKILFSLCLIATIGLLMPVWISLSSENFQFLAFLSCASILFVAFSPNFLDDLAYEVHLGGAILGCTCAGAWILIDGYWWTLVLSALVGLGFWFKNKQKTVLIAELVILAALYMSIIIRIFV